ncbi:hypothetical protein [Phenylobacterium sp.]|uniref:hypothetical protein n=1 Tax=Phenylobacterium sp. TaxID=1871053 RepID=UPI002735B1E8|nr:hypothetical protein [Phenylobacterium sp.]MDP3854077.1 hypothetical protein [Phenylobacterium sp.]
MATYQIFLIDCLGSVEAETSFDATSDERAVAICSRANPGSQRLEVWAERRFVALFPQSRIDAQTAARAAALRLAGPYPAARAPLAVSL